MFTMDFHQLEGIIQGGPKIWCHFGSHPVFQDPRSLLTYWGHPWPFVTVQYQLHSQPGWPWPWPWDCGLGLDIVWPWPWSVGLGLECSGLVNITGYTVSCISYSWTKCVKTVKKNISADGEDMSKNEVACFFLGHGVV